MKQNLKLRSGFDERWAYIQNIWRSNQWLYMVSGIMIGILFSAFIAVRQDFLSSLFPEAIGITFTALVIDRLNRQREEERLKEQLIREMSSSDNGIAVRAVQELASKPDDKSDIQKYIRDGSLSRKVFDSANLRRADFVGADLMGSSFAWADLKRAHFEIAHLEGTVFADADLLGAEGLESAYFDARTVLPDSNFWVPGTNWKYFTDLNYPGGCWRSGDPDSPAFLGNVIREAVQKNT